MAHLVRCPHCQATKRVDPRLPEVAMFGSPVMVCARCGQEFDEWAHVVRTGNGRDRGAG